jgi:hypothetical protein
MDMDKLWQNAGARLRWKRKAALIAARSMGKPCGKLRATRPNMKIVKQFCVLCRVLRWLKSLVKSAI